MHQSRIWLICSLVAFQAIQGLKVLDVNFEAPSTSFETTFPASFNRLSSTEPASFETLTKNGLKILSERLQTDLSEMQVKTSFQDEHNGMFHLYVMQFIDGAPVVNSVASVSLDRFGNPIKVSNSWAKVSHKERRSLRKRYVELTASQAVLSLAKLLEFNVDPQRLEEKSIDDSTIDVYGANMTVSQNIRCTKVSFKTEKELIPVWSVQAQLTDHWYDAMISRVDGKLVASNDFANTAIMSNEHESVTHDDVAPAELVDLHVRQAPSTANRDPAEYVIFPVNPTKNQVVVRELAQTASPYGWHTRPDTTSGNNVIARSMNNNFQPSAQNGKFSYAVNDKAQEPGQYVSASVTNAFVHTNIFHDLTYAYGFTPETGNFQARDYGKGRVGGTNDPIVVSIHDGATNNAYFISGPDGQPGVMRLSLFTTTTPRRDTALEADIVIHEAMHGVTNRLTGGAGNPNCLTSPAAAGMGEGWSDMIALVFKMNPNSKRTESYPMGDYVTNSAKGIRAYPYSTDLAVNPLTYGRVRNVVARDPHSAGTVWATILNEVYWNLVDEKGFGELKDTKSGKGNVIFLQLMMDSLKLQPCNPDFVSARDAFMAADRASFQGANTCSMWKGFAKRGLGVGADNTFRESNAIPPECNK